MNERRSALLIANSEYEDSGLRRLVAPARDAEALGRVLADPDVGGFEVKTLLSRPAREVNVEIERFFLNRKSEDLLLLYYSGHGLRDDDGQLYLTAADTQLIDGVRPLRATAVGASFIKDVMLSGSSRRQVLALDCCYSGAFAKALISKGGATLTIQDQFAEGRGLVLLTASAAIQPSLEGKGAGAPSVFTRHLVQGIETGEADRDGDGLISLDELYEYVRDHVTDETPQQRPMKWAFDVEREIVIAQVPEAALKASELSPELEQAIESTSFPRLREDAVRELGRLLRGKHQGRKLAARQALLKLRGNDDSLRVRNAAAQSLAEYEDENREQLRAEAERAAQQKAEQEHQERERAHAAPVAPAQAEQAIRGSEAKDRAEGNAEQDVPASERARPELTGSAFFSYAREDSEFALRLAQDLRAFRASVWLDQLDISLGERWDRAVQEALQNCATLLVVLSPSSVESNNVMDEVNFALEEQKIIIPALYRECRIPFRLRRFQYIDFRVEYEAGLKQLVDALNEAERERQAKEQARLAREKAEDEQGRQEREKAEAAERETWAKAQAEKERLEAEAERAARQKAEQQRQQWEGAEAAERERQAKAQAEHKRLAREKAEQERLRTEEGRAARAIRPVIADFVGRHWWWLASPVILLTLVWGVGLAAAYWRIQTAIHQGDFYFAKRAYEEALRTYQKGLARNPQNSALKAKIKQALDAIATREAGSKQVNDLMKQGDSHYEQRAYKEAVGEYQKALSLDPVNPVPQERVQRAREALKKQVGDLVKQGDSYYEQGAYGEAIGEYRKALSLDPGNAVPQERLQRAREAPERQASDLMSQGDSYYEIGGYGQAIRAYQKALVLDPQDSVLQQRLQRARRKQIDSLMASADRCYENAQYDKAIEQYQKALALDRNNQQLVKKIKSASSAREWERQHARSNN
jgi:tetratricopeptide (TPR) repeat protein